MSVKEDWPRKYKGREFRENFEKIQWESSDAVSDEWNGTCPRCGSRDVEEGGKYYLECLQCGNHVSCS